MKSFWQTWMSKVPTGKHFIPWKEHTASFCLLQKTKASPGTPRGPCKAIQGPVLALLEMTHCFARCPVLCSFFPRKTLFPCTYRARAQSKSRCQGLSSHKSKRFTVPSQTWICEERSCRRNTLRSLRMKFPILSTCVINYLVSALWMTIWKKKNQLF